MKLNNSLIRFRDIYYTKYDHTAYNNDKFTTKCKMQLDSQIYNRKESECILLDKQTINSLNFVVRYSLVKFSAIYSPMS